MKFSFSITYFELINGIKGKEKLSEAYTQRNELLKVLLSKFSEYKRIT